LTPTTHKTAISAIFKTFSSISDAYFHTILALKRSRSHNTFKPYHILPELARGIRRWVQCAWGQHIEDEDEDSAVYTLIYGFAQPLNYKTVESCLLAW